MEPEPQRPSPQTLNYAAPPAVTRPSMVLATLFALPGLLCWCVFLGRGILIEFWSGLYFMTWPGLDWTVADSIWLVAVLTAIASFIYYGIRWRQPTPWYVILCLALNGCGLLFSLFPFLA